MGSSQGMIQKDPCVVRDEVPTAAYLTQGPINHPMKPGIPLAKNPEHGRAEEYGGFELHD